MSRYYPSDWADQERQRLDYLASVGYGCDCAPSEPSCCPAPVPCCPCPTGPQDVPQSDETADPAEPTTPAETATPAAPVADATDDTIVAQFNTLLASLRAAGLLADDGAAPPEVLEP